MTAPLKVPLKVPLKIASWCWTRIARTVTTIVGFARENAPESATRLVMLACTYGGLRAAERAFQFAMEHPSETGTTGILASVVAAFILNGAIALGLRTRKGGEPGDAPPAPPPAGPPIPQAVP